MTDYPRDMRGYGRAYLRANWPGGARTAVQFVINYRRRRRELRVARRCRLRGFPVRNCRRAADRRPAPHEHGVDLRIRLACRFLATASHVHGARYAGHGFGVAMALERNPEAVVAMQDSGWEIASHGYRWIDYPVRRRSHRTRALDEGDRASRTRNRGAPGGLVPGPLQPEQPSHGGRGGRLRI